MSTTKISSKYQVVIPRDIREQMNLHEGQTLYVERLSDSELRLSTKSALDRYAGSLAGVWGDEDPAIQIRRDRDNWGARRS